MSHYGPMCKICGIYRYAGCCACVKPLIEETEETEELVKRVNKLFNRFNRFKAGRLQGQHSHVITIPDDWLEEVRELLRSIETEKPKGVLDNPYEGVHPKEEGEEGFFRDAIDFIDGQKP